MYIYIHIPFCESKCKYCKFASFSGIQKLQIEKYVSFLCKEISYPLTLSLPGREDLNLQSIYFGGGTPSTLNLDQFKKILDTIKNKYTFSDDIEISIESTPTNISLENIKGWKKLGINRLSMGIQSLNNNTLVEIGRGNKKNIFEALDILKKSEFDNISIDFIIGLPYVKKGEIKKDIEFILGKYNFIKHISVYMLEAIPLS